MTVLTQIAIEEFLVDIARIIVLTVLAGAAGVGLGGVYRWYAKETVPDGLAVLVGLSVVALYLNTAGVLGDVIGGQQDLLAIDAAIFNVVTFFIAALAASGGGRLGDRMGISLFVGSPGGSVDGDINRIVRAVGRVITVEIPEEIEDIDGYDPVDEATKAKLKGQRLVFPRRLSVEELRARLIERLRVDYDIGHVDVDIADDGTVEYLALGGRESGLGPTLPPGTAAVAVKADPANNASSGDSVQLWRPGAEGPQRIVTAEVRGTVEDVVTLAVDDEEARRLDTEPRYRLVTLPVEARIDREFAAQLRAAEETMRSITIGEGSRFTSATVGDLEVAIAAVRTANGEVVAIPRRNRQLSVGETIYVIARPDRIRRIESDAAGVSAENTTVPDSTD